MATGKPAMTAELRVRQILYVAPTRQAGVRTPTAHTGTEILAQTTVLVIKMLTTVKLLQLPRPLLMMLAVVTGTFSVLNMLLLLLLLMMMILTMMTIFMKMKFDEVVLPLIMYRHSSEVDDGDDEEDDE